MHAPVVGPKRCDSSSEVFAASDTVRTINPLAHRVVQFIERPDLDPMHVTKA